MATISQVVPVIEFSDNGVDWFADPGDRAYKRVIRPFNPSWDREQCEFFLGLRENARIEYSQDGGYSWTPFRTGYAREDAARIYTMMQRNYQVRFLQISQIGQIKVTDTQSPTAGSFFAAVNRAQQSSMMGSGIKVPRVTTDNMYIFRMSDGEYVFDRERAYWVDTMNAIEITRIERKTVYDMKIPNENVEHPTGEGLKRNQAALRVRGFLFEMYDAKDETGLAHWWPVILGSNKDFKAEDYMVFKSARLYDAEMDQFFMNIGASPIAVISGKYVVGWGNRFKMGDTWLLKKDVCQAAVNRILAKGGRISGPRVERQLIQRQNEKNLGVQFTTAEVEPGYIMQIRLALEEMVRVGDNQQIMDSLIKVVDFRNKCVDELKALNASIDAARAQVQANLEREVK